jgi:hypothetical protein
MHKSFAVGDRVTWKSQAAGSWKQKTGTVVEVVPAHRIPRDKNFGSSRTHDSYIVEVTFEPKRSTSAIKSVRQRKPERYWPRVSNLRLVEAGSTSAVENPALMRPHPTGVTDPGTFDGDQLTFEDLKTDHLPMQALDGDKDMLWKDVQDIESANDASVN